MSRHEMLQWVNERINEKLPKIEALCSGAAYCQMLEQLYPHCIGVKRIKLNAKMEHEFLHNFKLLQAAFSTLKIDKTVPVDRLLKGRFQDNFEFIQWFKKFYEDQAKNSTAPTAMNSRSNSVKNLTKRTPSPAHLHSLENQRQELATSIDIIQKDKDFYFDKLTQIEKLLLENHDAGIKVDFCKRGLDILYNACAEEEEQQVQEQRIEQVGDQTDAGHNE